MNNRIDDKICEIEKYLDELEEIKPLNLEDYIKDIKTKAACERYFEKIVEACVDLASLVISYKRLNIPEDDEKAFYVLSHNNIITMELANKLKEAKGMRNIIAHEYGKVDDELVFPAVKEELIPDVEKFLQKIKETI